MAQAKNSLPLKKLVAGAVVLAGATVCVNLLLAPTSVTQLDSSAVGAITNEATFKTTLGDGSRAIHVFLSSECTFCRKLEPELAHLENVTVYRHMLPGRTETSRRLAVDVWCSKDPAEEWQRIAAGRPAGLATCDATALEKNQALVQRLKLTYTPSIVYADGHVSTGMLSSGEIAENISKAGAR
ncbi:DsbC family protein [Massilia aerilata]|uniref:Thiol:disulfide interchange protein n=1 Tax=Massilia aerilata TaxID=453817 RepID=A0ABW0S179_9BURK